MAKINIIKDTATNGKNLSTLQRKWASMKQH